MSFPRYPAYKDSGVKWMGEVPEHWEVDRLKYIAKASPSNVDKKSYEGDHAVLLCNYTDVYYNEEIVAGMSFMAATATTDQVEKFTLREGDTIITKDSETADDIAISAYVPQSLPGVVCGYHLSLIRPREGIDGRFIKRLFDSHFARSTLGIAANGLTRYGLSQYPLDNFELPLPPAGEQTAIATFLDRETAKIDALVADYRILIELLQEKRQAVISHAVTKGLDSTVPMKDSGVEWLGEVPEHWAIMQSRRMFRVRNEPAQETDVQLTASQRYGMIPQSEFIEREGRKVVELIKGIDALRHAESGDFIISLRSFQGGIEWCKRSGSVTFHYVVLVPVKHVVGRYFAYLFKSLSYIQALRSTTNLIRDGQDLRWSHFVQLDIPVLPPHEQAAIASFLDQEIEKMDSLMADAEKAINLLQERRTALISAAVTGKIDVRGLVAEATPVAIPETSLAISQP